MTSINQAAFLAAFIEAAGNISEAAKVVGIDRALHYRWLDDPAYFAAFTRAKKEAGQSLVDEAIRRGHKGVWKPVFYQGVQCGETLEYSDGLLTRLLEANVSEFKRTTKHEHTGLDGGPIAVKHEGLAKLTDDQLAQLTEVARILAVSGGTGSGEAAAEPEQD